MSSKPTRRELEQARRELEETSRNAPRRGRLGREETKEYHAANDKVAAIEDQMPWWKKW